MIVHIRFNQNYDSFCTFHFQFQNIADLFGINVRTGCFCNSGSCQRHLQATNQEMKEMYKAGHKCGDEFDLVNGRPTGAIRASFGYYNTYEDVDKLIQMISRCFVPTKINTPKRQMIDSKMMEISNSIRIFNKESLKKSNDQQFLKNIDNYVPNSLNSKVDSNSMAISTNKIILKEIAIFPIKSCGAFKIRTGWKIGSKGFEFDREWMIIKDNGVCLTQKQNSRMCMIRPKIDTNHKLLILNFKGNFHS